jgi:nucleoside phosphorylase
LPVSTGSALPLVPLARCDILLVAAFVPELAALRASFGEGMSARIDAVDVAARVVGIGLPMAAAGTAMQLAELRPRAVVALGTCGVYPNDSLAGAAAGADASPPLAIGEVVVARRIRLVDASVVAGVAQIPEPMSSVIEADAALADGLERAGARRADVATTLAITVDDATARRMALTASVQVEHLEAFGMAAACAAQGVPFGAALGIANFVGARARDEWRVHHRQAAAAAADVALRWLRASATSP